MPDNHRARFLAPAASTPPNRLSRIGPMPFVRISSDHELEGSDECDQWLCRGAGSPARAAEIGGLPFRSHGDPRPVSHLQSRYQNKIAIIGTEDRGLAFLHLEPVLAEGI